MRILLATKGSSHSDVAVRFATQLAQIFDLHVTVLTVIRRPGEQVAVGEILEHVVGELKTAVTHVQTVVRIGDPAGEILREARDGKYDLILTGQRPVHSLLTRLLGSVTQQVIADLPLPIIIAKGEITPVRHILVCDSGMQEPPLLQRLQVALPALLIPQTDVTCLHVMSQISAGPGVVGKQLRAEAEELIAARTPEGEWLERDMEILEAAQVQHQPKVRHGLVVDEILAESRSGEYDLVVIGAHRDEGWQELLLDNIARQIVEQVPRPVMVVP